MKDYYLGFDPGKKGYMCLYNAGYSGYKHYPLFDGNRLNREMLDTIEKLAETYTMIAVVEQVHSMPHQGVASTFSFGINYGMILGALEAIGIPYSTVTPGKWQKFICEAVDKASNPKQMHYNAARRLFPNMDFRRSERCRIYDDNKVDATLICEYGVRKQL
jgi:crossover junction endodeoxyribonuclease RuvC